MKDSLSGPSIIDNHRLTEENSRLGALFASKAFVQLFINPLVGKATQKIGYEIPFVLGTALILLSSSSKKYFRGPGPRGLNTIFPLHSGFFPAAIFLPR